MNGTMHTITETDLQHAAEFKAIVSMRIREGEDLNYRVYVVTKGDKTEKALTTLRDRTKPRDWVSLDRLVKHIRNRYGVIPSITLTLNHP